MTGHPTTPIPQPGFHSDTRDKVKSTAGTDGCWTLRVSLTRAGEGEEQHHSYVLLQAAPTLWESSSRSCCVKSRQVPSWLQVEAHRPAHAALLGMKALSQKAHSRPLLESYHITAAADSTFSIHMRSKQILSALRQVVVQWLEENTTHHLSGTILGINLTPGQSLHTAKPPIAITMGKKD